MTGTVPAREEAGWHARRHGARAATAPRAAGIVSRVLASVVDTTVVLAVMGSTLLLVAAVLFLWSPLHFAWPSPSWLLTLGFGWVLSASYLTVAWATSGRTFGAAVLGLRVCGRGGEPLGWTRSALRSALCVAFPPGLFWCVLSPRRLSVADLVLRTAVVYDWEDARYAVPGPAHPVA